MAKQAKGHDDQAKLVLIAEPWRTQAAAVTDAESDRACSLMPKNSGISAS
jgi:hypothetical protein